MAQINLTTTWTQINNQVLETECIFVNGINPIEIILSSSPQSSDKGRIFLRNSFYYPYTNIDTYARSNTGTSSITTQLRNNVVNNSIITAFHQGIFWQLDIKLMKLTLSPSIDAGSIPNLDTLMSTAVTWLGSYGFEMVPQVRGLSLFDVVNPERTDSGIAMMLINNTIGGYGLYKAETKRALTGLYQIDAGEIILKIRNKG